MFGLLNVSKAFLELAAGELAGKWWWPVVWWAGRLAGRQAGGMFFVFLMIAILIGVRCNLNVLICISLMAEEVEEI
jgi:hypothetical protein